MCGYLANHDPVDRLLDNAASGKSLLQKRAVLHFTFIPEVILHRDEELAKVTQSLLPILKKNFLIKLEWKVWCVGLPEINLTIVKTVLS